MEWFFEFSTEQDQREIRDYYSTYSSPVFEQSPAFLQESFLFPYTAGQDFVMFLYDRGGWEAIEEAYLNPPVSTEQIMHPELYPNETPVVVELPEFEPILGEDWREISRNVMGEYYTYLVLAHGEDPEARLSEAVALDAAAGWGGDTYLVYYNDDTGETIMMMKTVWDRSEDARQFADAFQQYASARFGSPTSQSTDVWQWEDMEGLTAFSLQGNRTTWIFAPNARLLEQIQAQLQD
jgi:hypothetical protein